MTCIGKFFYIVFSWPTFYSSKILPTMITVPHGISIMMTCNHNGIFHTSMLSMINPFFRYSFCRQFWTKDLLCYFSLGFFLIFFIVVCPFSCFHGGIYTLMTDKKNY